uniref:Uncharacterized protein n=1 Tax=Romanomermis culicivorax TaxID=13658 RepID=A0A915L8J2_ROMCU
MQSTQRYRTREIFVPFGWRLPSAKLKLKLQRANTNALPPAKWNWTCFRDPNIRSEFQIALSNQFAMLKPSDYINQEEKQPSVFVMESAAELCLPVCRRTQQWISDECLDIIEQRKRAKHINLGQYRRLNKDV